MNLWQNYVSPTSVSEAIEALASAPGPALPLAGGTDLLLDLEQGRHSPVHTLVDLTTIPELQLLELRGDRLFIGAAMPLNRIARHPLTLEHAQALVEACDLVGGPQVRNVATLGGNVAHALPAADGTIALLALDAEAEVAGKAGPRRVPFHDLFLGPGKSALKHGEELLVGFYIPLIESPVRPEEASAPNSISKGIKTSGISRASCFKRIMRPQGVALPIINLAVWLERDGKSIRDVNIAVGPGSSVPFRARAAEDTLRGRRLEGKIVDVALEKLLEEVRFRSSARRASADYRRHLAGGLFRDVIATAWERSQRGKMKEERK